MLYYFKNNKGLNLLELMTATAVLVIAVCGLLAIFTKLLALNENARRLTLAMTSAHEKMEEIRDSNFDTLYSAYNGTRFDPRGLPPADAEGNVTVINTDPSLLKIYVTVSWKGRSDKITGEDLNLNGALDPGEDLNGNNRLDSPAGIVSLMGRR
jgi:Tfp pilus assembly protein PilV